MTHIDFRKIRSPKASYKRVFELGNTCNSFHENSIFCIISVSKRNTNVYVEYKRRQILYSIFFVVYSSY